jgi:hypothetical protein
MPSSFTPWSPLGPPVLVFPAGAVVGAAVRRPGHIDLLAASNDSSLWLWTYDDGAQGSGWSNLVNIGQMATTPAAPVGTVVGSQPVLGVIGAARSGDALDVYMPADDGNIWTTRGVPRRGRRSSGAPSGPSRAAWPARSPRW